ncbi:putative quinol monooxygenase [Granulosicoccus antarcticus]|uniref:ABM domain-containing protein n=1 Tax=Granulosicoccus antarcticus IMCC3135 TaxID=1192854 RepID=A0A2Z2NSD8_9GAMM|nr:antibiotic biosynthesis monooxygenase [Granulosicoccus antarcticus]ASJ74412.1 hypothetical protein IMCC3135_21675 [Granulosicoccus antarcticus IMCC3135]
MSTQENHSPSTSKIMALEAFEHVPNDNVARYLELAQIIDDQVRDEEPGMLLHALTQFSKSDTETVFKWLEVFENADALEAHLGSKHVAAHIEKLADGILEGRIDLVIYADWDEATRTYWQNHFSAVNFSFAAVESGFYRQR